MPSARRDVTFMTARLFRMLLALIMVGPLVAAGCGGPAPAPEKEEPAAEKPADDKAADAPADEKAADAPADEKPAADAKEVEKKS
ncbi:hypothetical protein Pan216_35010 [Planctomycetes bacterium Pan216]|uniref:Uncharacterized protein n=2 Tax=Kolteria novifilia TaxID=2527975 RepID=A0A518B6N9_9BACT|nr:hypothetical protein Pan216_35010 [Planctomycetes bacterium Pan216]